MDVLRDETDDVVEWKKLGKALEVTKAKMKEIGDSKGGSSKKLKMMLVAWLEQGENSGPLEPMPTWRTLYEAVQSLGYSEVAEYIATNYSCSCTECLPVHHHGKHA